MNISDVDKNFKVETEIEREGLVFRNILSEPFSVYGVFRENDAWVRMPDAVAKEVSHGVHVLSKHTAGGRVRFVTDSPYIAIKAVQSGRPNMNHMPASGQAGFDLYAGAGKNPIYRKSFIPPSGCVNGFEGVYDIGRSEKKVYTINFPLYFNVKELYIGLKEGSLLEKAPEYAITTPFVYYGSSITQGGCASRPGNAYQGLISRKYDADFINLGFSGGAKAEPAIAEYIAGLDMSLFVYDYDFNTPTVEHLEATHEKMFLRIRETHPDTPIVIMSRPIFTLTDNDKRYMVIKKTYDNAVARGDKNVYYIPGYELMSICEAEGTVDGTHPTDLGFFAMANRLSEVIDKILEK